MYLPFFASCFVLVGLLYTSSVARRPTREMGSNIRTHRATTGPSTAAYTRLPNDSTASIASSTQVDHAKQEILGNTKDQSFRGDAPRRDEEEYGEEEFEDDYDEERRQDGVRQAEAITSVWTLRILILTYILYVKELNI